MKVVQEVTRLTQNDCFKVFLRERSGFNSPLHQHDDMEINLILNAPGARRIVGDHVSDIEDSELVCVGPNVVHGWFTHDCKSHSIKEITIQFPKDLFDERYLNTNQLISIRNLFENSKRGILFSKLTAYSMSKRIQALTKKTGFESIIELLSIIHELATSRNAKFLSNSAFTAKTHHYYNRRLDRVFGLMNQNFSKHITLAEVAGLADMSEASFSRFIKNHTGYSFTDSLNEIRLGHVSRMLIDTTQSISEIAFKCGFNNIAHFNRTFKSKKNFTPKEFRAAYALKAITLVV
jgi:AraC-like DNA-binding protein